MKPPYYCFLTGAGASDTQRKPTWLVDVSVSSPWREVAR